VTTTKSFIILVTKTLLAATSQKGKQKNFAKKVETPFVWQTFLSRRVTRHNGIQLKGKRVNEKHHTQPENNSASTVVVLSLLSDVCFNVVLDFLMLNAVMLNVVMLCIVMLCVDYAVCCYTECRLS
jgi:hypothetical protein